MGLSARRGTTIHEAAHAVVSHLLGMPFVSVTVLGDTRGELVPQCAACNAPAVSICESCLEHYQQHDPLQDARAADIQDKLRCSAAVAVAGEIGEEVLLGHCMGSSEELAEDRDIATRRAAEVHLWSNSRCSLGLDETCAECAAFLDHLRQAVRRLVTKASVSSAIAALATELEGGRRMATDEVAALLEARGIDGASIGPGKLPQAPTRRGVSGP